MKTYLVLQIIFSIIVLCNISEAEGIKEILTGFKPKGCEKGVDCLVTVLNVRSPDTLFVMFRDNRTATVRLIGVKKSASPNQTAVETIKKYLEMDDIFPIVKLEFDKIVKDDKKNLLAYVYYQGQMLNTWIISNELGTYDGSGKNLKYKEKFKNITNQLYERRRKK